MNFVERLGRRKEEARAGLELAQGNRLAGIVVGLAKAGVDKITILTSDARRPFGAWLAQFLSDKGVIPILGEPVGRKDSYGHDRLFVSFAAETDAHDVSYLAESGHTVLQWKGEEDRALWESAGPLIAQLLAYRPPPESPSEPSSPSLDADGLQLFAEHAAILKAAAGFLGPKVAASAAGWIAAHIALADPGDFVAFLTRDEALQRELEPVQGALRNATKLACTAGPAPLSTKGLYLQLATGENLAGLRAVRVQGDSKTIVDTLYAAVKHLSPK